MVAGGGGGGGATGFGRGGGGGAACPLVADTPPTPSALLKSRESGARLGWGTPPLTASPSWPRPPPVVSPGACDESPLDPSSPPDNRPPQPPHLDLWGSPCRGQGRGRRGGGELAVGHHRKLHRLRDPRWPPGGGGEGCRQGSREGFRGEWGSGAGRRRGQLAEEEVCGWRGLTPGWRRRASQAP